MHIKEISVINYKNYEDVSVKLHPKVNCFVGDNGAGKTNFLDAVYYLCMCKGYFQGTDQYCIRKDQEFMVIQSVFSKENTDYEIYCGLKTGKRKIFRKNKKEYPKLSEHIGQFPVVMITPSDSSLIIDGNEERRKYMNAVISQYSNSYLESTIQYNKILTQRNRLLKEMNIHPEAFDLLEVYNNQLIPLGIKIHNERKKFVEKLTPVFQNYYNKISHGKEIINIKYISQLNDNNYEVLLGQSQKKDLLLQHTSIGIHKDDLELTMNGLPIKKTGSQGQQKTFVVALKLAQFVFLKEIRKFPPILLLDDIFDKFDGKRVKEILHLVADDSFGQILITHTNKDRMYELLTEFPNNYNLFMVENGVINTFEK